MCDFISWGVCTPAFAKARDLPRILFLTDDMAQSLIDRPRHPQDRRWTWYDVQGHSAIAAYYHILENDFVHHESKTRIPRVIAAAHRAGQMTLLAKHAGYSKFRFTTKGTRKASSLEYATPAYHALLKEAIRVVTSDPRYSSLDPATMLDFVWKKVAARDTDMSDAFTWILSPGGSDFWAQVWYQTTNEVAGFDPCEYIAVPESVLALRAAFEAEGTSPR